MECTIRVGAEGIRGRMIERFSNGDAALETDNVGRKLYEGFEPEIVVGGTPNDIGGTAERVAMSNN